MSVDRSNLVTLANPRSPAAEAYRTLRTNLQLSSLDRPIRSLLVTSAAPDEGKSTTLANLGVAFAQAGSRVVLVDSDLRRPTLHTIFGVPNERGLTTMLLSEDAPPPLSTTELEGLLLLPSGPLPPNPSELLASRRVEVAIERLCAGSELVVFDSPPLLAVSDAAVLARRVDGVVLVVSAGKTKRDQATRARQMLERAGARVLGVVLNNARGDETAYGYYG